MPNALLDAIFFDVDDTLFSTSQFAEKAREASVDAMIKVGLEIERDVLLQELHEVVAEFTSNYDHHFDQLLRRIPKRYFKGVNPAIIIAAGVVAYHDTKMRELAPYPDAVELLRALAGVPDLVRGIITSGLMIKQAEKLVRLGVYDLMTPTAIFISDQIGINKPNPKLYRRACSDLNLKPARCIYVGDRPRSDVDPPNALGMITVQMKRGGRHEKEEGKTKPVHEVRDFGELRAILERTYSLPLGGGPAPPPPEEGDVTDARQKASV
ncbi:MAG TPA: TIGR02253 family HAD-type hydrolase [Planctomycetota bacterium]|nr:TIGR02253 family HAD-type hydrolase [Planctomycetota bacterium]